MQHIPQHRSGRSLITKLVRVGWVGFCLLFVAACHLDMYNQPKYGPYEETTFFRDGAASRPLEPGTVARQPGSVAQTEQQSKVLVTGREGDGYAQENPLLINTEVISRGQERFNIFCAPCHGQVANGRSGITYRYFNPGPPSFYIDRLITAPDGYFYDVITNGRGQMFSYASRIPIEDRWAIVAYIRYLQENPPEQITPEDRLEQTPTPAAEQGGTQQNTTSATPQPTATQ